MDASPPSPNQANHCATTAFIATGDRNAAESAVRMPISLAEKFFPPRAVREQRANLNFAKTPPKKSDSFRAATSEKNSVLGAGAALNKSGVDGSRFHRNNHADNNNVNNSDDSQPSSMSNTVEIQK